jgi:hypothetical protein
MGEVFFDVRGSSRSMRLSWYADTGVAVFSIWQGGMCTGTFRLPIGDLPRMVETLRRGPTERTSRERPASRPRRGRGAADPVESPDDMFESAADSSPDDGWATSDPQGYPAEPGAGGDPLGYRAEPMAGGEPPGYPAQPGTASYPAAHRATSRARGGPPGYAAEPGPGSGPPGYPPGPAAGDSLGYRGQPGDPLDYRPRPGIGGDPLDYSGDPYPATGSRDYRHVPPGSDYQPGPSSGDSWEQYGMADRDGNEREGAPETFPPRPHA